MLSTTTAQNLEILENGVFTENIEIIKHSFPTSQSSEFLNRKCDIPGCSKMSSRSRLKPDMIRATNLIDESYKQHLLECNVKLYVCGSHNWQMKGKSKKYRSSNGMGYENSIDGFNDSRDDLAAYDSSKDDETKRTYEQCSNNDSFRYSESIYNKPQPDLKEWDFVEPSSLLQADHSNYEKDMQRSEIQNPEINVQPIGSSIDIQKHGLNQNEVNEESNLRQIQQNNESLNNPTLQHLLQHPQVQALLQQQHQHLQRFLQQQHMQLVHVMQHLYQQQQRPEYQSTYDQKYFNPSAQPIYQDENTLSQMF